MLRNLAIAPNSFAATSTLSLLAHTASSSASTTTPAIDTSGATLIVAVGGTWNSPPTMSDSEGNTWTVATTTTVANSACSRILYVANPTTGTSHTFTVSGSNAPTCAILAFGGAGVLDQTNEAATNSPPNTLWQPGSVTPGVNGELIVTGFDVDGSSVSPTIDSGFTVTDVVAYGANVEGIAAAYLVQATAGAIDPTWTYGGGHTIAATIASFRPASALATRRADAVVGLQGGVGIRASGW